MFEHTTAITSFSVDDIATAERFYADTLGLKAARESDQDATVLWLRLVDGHNVLIYPKPDHIPASYTVLNFAVDDIDRAVDQLTSRGVRLLRFDEFGTDERGILRTEARDIAWFADPAGNVHSVAHLKVAPRTPGGG
jgi:catechol 2,3-dioxygenase-like lactoylglutathione lyase family enzyme